MWFKQKPIIALAPMADWTDGPFCILCREVSGGDFVIFREMVSAEAIVRNSVKTLKMCEFTDKERPIVIQIFGAKPDSMAAAAKIIVDKFKPDGIDINMGCPVTKIAGKGGGGAYLLKHKDLAIEILQAVKAQNLGVPVSVKTRLGWSDPDEILSFAPQLEAAGADLLTIHGRTKKQGYSGKADWERIAAVKKIVKIPVIANGDIGDKKDVEDCLKTTGCDGVMIGRAVLGNPWILKNIKENNGRNNVKELKKVVWRHAGLHVARYGEKSVVTFRKHLLAYFKGWQDLRKIKPALAQVKSLEEIKNILEKILE